MKPWSGLMYRGMGLLGSGGGYWDVRVGVLVADGLEGC